MALIIVLFIAAILGGALIGVLAILTIGIHAYGRSRHLGDPPRTYAESVTHRLLGVTVRTGKPDYHEPEGS